MTKFLNISTDNTLGGSSPSDETVSSQKALKTYIDAHASGSPSWGSITGTLSNQTDLKNALDAKYDASNPNGYTSNVGTVTSVNNVSPVNGNVTLSIPTVDQTYSASSTNAQSGAAINGANFIVNNAASSTNGVAVKGSGSVQSTQIGALGSASSMSTSVGFSAYATGSQSITIGHGAQATASKSYAFGEQAKSTAIGAFQFGQATNSEAGSVYFGLTTDGSTTTNYKLLGSDGKIPDDRLNTTIARTSAIPTESTVSGWGFTKNTGTVTSVNNVSPVNGNVTLSIPTVNNATLTLTQGGTTKGTFTANASSNVTIDLDAGGGSVDVDNKSITTNASDQIQTVGVIDSNNTTNAIKTWTGTKAQYNAITTKDSSTLYNITDDTDVTLTILEALYPVGSIYITTANTCPLSALISGSTWELVSSGRVLQGADSGHSAGTTIEAGLPNITGKVGRFIVEGGYITPEGALYTSDAVTGRASTGSNNTSYGVNIDASLSSSVYGNSSTVQPPAYVVNIFERTA